MRKDKAMSFVFVDKLFAMGKRIFYE